MTRPNISWQEFLNYVSGANAALKKWLETTIGQGKISQNEADKYYTEHSAKIAALNTMLANASQSTAPTFNLAIRGYYLNSMGEKEKNDRGIYDDAFALCGPAYLKTFNANTDPRKAGFGIGTLMPGLHEFKQGFHGYGKPSGHNAFRTANLKQILPVLRDGQTGIKDGITVNLHMGGEYSTNSIACQTVVKSQWKEFKDDAYKLTDKTEKILKYLLVDQASY